MAGAHARKGGWRSHPALFAGCMALLAVLLAPLTRWTCTTTPPPWAPAPGGAQALAKRPTPTPASPTDSRLVRRATRTHRLIPALSRPSSLPILFVSPAAPGAAVWVVHGRGAYAPASASQPPAEGAGGAGGDGREGSGEPPPLSDAASAAGGGGGDGGGGGGRMPPSGGGTPTPSYSPSPSPTKTPAGAATPATATTSIDTVHSSSDSANSPSPSASTPSEGDEPMGGGESPANEPLLPLNDPMEGDTQPAAPAGAVGEVGGGDGNPYAGFTRAQLMDVLRGIRDGITHATFTGSTDLLLHDLNELSDDQLRDCLAVDGWARARIQQQEAGGDLLNPYGPEFANMVRDGNAAIDALLGQEGALPEPSVGQLMGTLLEPQRIAQLVVSVNIARSRAASAFAAANAGIRVLPLTREGTPPGGGPRPLPIYPPLPPAPGGEAPAAPQRLVLGAPAGGWGLRQLAEVLGVNQPTLGARIIAAREALEAADPAAVRGRPRGTPRSCGSPALATPTPRCPPTRSWPICRSCAERAKRAELYV